METWKDIPGYNGLYQVSNLGRVKSFFYHGKPKVRIIKPSLTIYGYHYVTIRNRNGVRKTYGVHRLVALAFIKNPKGLPEVNHIDHNGLNNYVENLEWITCSANIKHSYKNPKRKPMDKTRCPRIGRIKTLDEILKKSA